MSGRGPLAGGALAIVLATALAYSGSFDGAFVSDDHGAIERNEKIRGLDRAHLATIFTTFDDSNYMPLKVLSLAIDYRLWGLEPAGYHLTNLVLHLGCALVIYVLLLHLRLAPGAALLVALLWALHPLQVESVAWISERKNVLAGLAFFAAVYGWVRWARDGGAWRYALMLVAYVVALLSKMNTMVLPAVGLAYAATIQGRIRGRDLVATVPLLTLAALVAWYNLAANPATVHGIAWHGGGPLVTWLSSIVVVFRYLGETFAPVGLTPSYYVPLRGSLADPAVLASALGIATLIALIVTTRRRAEAFWILWFGITLAPMLNLLVPGATLKQDRYMHLALLGPLAAVATYASTLPPAARRAAAVAGAVAVVACGILTYRQVEVWSSDLTMWQATALRIPMGAAEPGRAASDHDAKVAFLAAAVARRPASATLRNNLAALYYTEGRMADAMEQWRIATRLDPDALLVSWNVGRAYLRAGDTGAARDALERATAIAPYFLPAYMHLARVYLAMGDTAAARRALDTCHRLRPDAGAAVAWRREQLLLERLEAQGR